MQKFDNLNKVFDWLVQDRFPFLVNLISIHDDPDDSSVDLFYLHCMFGCDATDDTGSKLNQLCRYEDGLAGLLKPGWESDLFSYSMHEWVMMVQYQQCESLF